MNTTFMTACKIFAITVLLTLTASARPTFQIPGDCRQVVVVTNSHWDDTTATMSTFERKSVQHDWKEVGSRVTVNLGRTGLAWGESPLMRGTTHKGELAKREGDGRSPAGLFPILEAFGHPRKPRGYSAQNLPFLLVSDHQGVDDKDSAFYNQIVRPSEVGGRTWNSAETMKIELYKMGLVVGHNLPRAKPGYGSCIFFHIQRGANKPTAGCTSMRTKELRELLLWLKADAQPVLLQLPEALYRDLPIGWPGRKARRTSWFKKS